MEIKHNKGRHQTLLARLRKAQAAVDEIQAKIADLVEEDRRLIAAESHPDSALLHVSGSAGTGYTRAVKIERVTKTMVMAAGRRFRRKSETFGWRSTPHHDEVGEFRHSYLTHVDPKWLE